MTRSRLQQSCCIARWSFFEPPHLVTQTVHDVLTMYGQMAMNPFLTSAYLLMAKAQKKTAPLNIQLKAPQRALIEQAASAAGMTVSGFVRDAALQQAKNALLDRANITLNEQEWAAFVEALDAPPASNPRLRDLMSRRATWEQ